MKVSILSLDSIGTTAAVERAANHALDYVGRVPSRRVSPDAVALEALSVFDEPLPAQGCDATDVLDQLHRYASPATVATTGGRFFGLVVGGATPAAMGAAMLAASWDQVAIMEAVAPSSVRLERVAARWVLDLLGLPATCSVGFATGSSVANLTTLAAARHALYRRMGVSIERVGLVGAPPLRVVVSEQVHVTVLKALHVLGIGQDQIERVACNRQGQVVPSAVPRLDERSLLCLQAGNVNSGASDPFPEIVDEARGAGAWVHVDGAFGLWAAASPTLQPLVDGVEGADSWTVDAHKWLNTPYDCGLAICRDPLAVHAVMTTQAPYLTHDGVAAPKDMVLEFSRRARGVEVWAALKEMGREGVIALLGRCCAHARALAVGLEAMGFEVLNEVVLNQVVATAGTPEQLQRLVSTVQEEGECWFGSTVWQGRAAIRLSVASWATTAHDIGRTLTAIKRAAVRVGIA
jgi:glutamate/tyrosine decarboxylase-like PLP-dependent enzyme